MTSKRRSLVVPSWLWGALLAVPGLTWSACDDDDDDEEDVTTDAGADAAVRDGAVFDATRDSQGGDAMALDDAEVAAVAAAINTGEINAAMVALARAQSTQVRNYAQLMINEHTAAQMRLATVLQTAAITPTPSALSQQVQIGGATVVDQLQITPAASFDTVYLQSQIGAHQFSRNLLMNTLIPAARNPSLKATLEMFFVEVSGHLMAAQQLVDERRPDGGVGDAGADAN